MIYNNHTNLFNCILSVAQVHYERSFSKLKIIKTRLRSFLPDDLLEASMLLSLEKELVIKLNNDEIIDQLANSSTEMNRLLSF